MSGILHLPQNGTIIDDETVSTKKTWSSSKINDYVNDSVSTNTAYFIGTFPTRSAMEAYSGAVSNNDYAFVEGHYELLTSRPNDWNTNYKSYYSGTVVAPSWVQNKYYYESEGEYILTTSKPADWSYAYEDYYTVFNETEYHHVVGVEKYTSITGDTAPEWEVDTYYSGSKYMYDRYKYNAGLDEWIYEYSLTNLEFTESQMNAINSKMSAKISAKLVNEGAKNQLRSKATDGEDGDLYWVVNDDGSIVVNIGGYGQYSNDATIPITGEDYVENLYYGMYLTGISDGGDDYAAIEISYSSDGVNATRVDYLYDGAIQIRFSGYIKIVGKVYGTGIEDFTFRPMICTADELSVSDTYRRFAVPNDTLTTFAASQVNNGAKNVLQITAQSQTINGVSFTVNGDGTVTVNRVSSSSSDALFILNDEPAVYYQMMLSGCPMEGGTNTCALKTTDEDIDYGFGYGYGMLIETRTATKVAILVKSGYSPNNLVFKPMVCSQTDFDISRDFVPYYPKVSDIYKSMNPMTQAQYEALQSYDYPLYYIYET